MILKNITYLLSKKSQLISELALQDMIKKSDALIFEKFMGLQTISRDHAWTVYDQIHDVFSLFLKHVSIQCDAIQYVLFAHTADYIAPQKIDVLSTLAHTHKLDNALCIASSAYKCATAFALIKMAKTLFESMHDNDYIILLIADSCFTEILRYIPGSTVMGDAASLILLHKSGKEHTVLDILIETDGRFSRGCLDSDAALLLFQTIYIDKLSTVIHSILERNKQTLSNIKIIFPHNVNSISWKQIATALKIPVEKIYLNNISKTGHCFGSDPFINLQDGILQGVISPGDYYLLVTVGLGATFAAILMQY